MRWLLLLTLVISSGITADPKSHYMIHCMGCHLSDGSGLPPDVPSFNADLGRFAASEAGRGYLIRVPGASQAPLNDHELADVLNWMLREYSPRSLPPDFQPITESEVIKYRPQTLTNPVEYRATLLRGEY